MQIKTMRYHLTSVRMAVIKKTRPKCQGGRTEKRNWCTAGGNGNWLSHYGNDMEVPQKIKIRTTTYSSNSTSGVYPKEMKTGYQRETCMPMFTAAWLTIAKIWKQPKCLSTDEWIKMWDTNTHTQTHTHTHTHTHNRLLFSHEKEGNSAICYNMDGCWGHYAKWDK